jgi:hypothetical protein
LPSLPIKTSAPGIANCESCKLQRASWASQHQRANDRVKHGSDGAINRQHDECDVRGTRIRDGSALFRPPSPSSRDAPQPPRASPLFRSSALLPYLRVVSAGRVHTKLHFIKQKFFFLPFLSNSKLMAHLCTVSSIKHHITHTYCTVSRRSPHTHYRPLTIF